MDKGFDPSSLKVNDLRDELRRRGLNPLGVKSVLLKRLSEALAKEDKTLEDFAKSLTEVKSPNKNVTAVEADSVASTEEAPMIPANGDSALDDKEGGDSSNDVSKLDEEKIEEDSNSDTSVQQPDSSAEISGDACKDHQNPGSTDQPAFEKITEESNGESKDESSEHRSENESPHKQFAIEKTSSDQSSERHRGYSREKDRTSRDRSRERRRHYSRDRSPRGGRDRSSDRERRRSPRRTRESSLTVDDEIDGWENREDVFLDFYNSDLSLVINQDCYSARPMTDDGFALMWAGARANYGVKSGKTFFEVKVVKELFVDSSDESMDDATHVLRVGWSMDKSGLTLGEEQNSFGYGGTGKKSTDGKFEDYGSSFKEGDVIGAFLEFTDSEVIITFSVNGANQGECFRFDKSSLGENSALFPHVYVKNVEFSVNFGQNDQSAWFPPAEDDHFVLIGTVPVEERVRGLLPPAKKEDCEVIMMIGLPGCGKTYYSSNLLKDHPEKYYNVLGTNLILDKMKVMGLSRKRNYSGRWDVLINKATQCLNKIISIACKRKRNYILDQTNVFPSAQRRKMRPFDGFQRKAIVIVPTDDEFKRRIEQRTKEEGKEVPEKAVLEMKANFDIPKPVSDDPASMFDEVTFTELQREEAEKLVKEYNAEGKASRSQDRRSRADSSEHSGHHSRSHRDDRHRDSRSRYDSYSRSSGRGDYDRRESRAFRFDYRGDRGDDRGRFGSRYRDDFGRGGRDSGRFGGVVRYDNELDYRRGPPGGGFQRSPRGAGGPYSGSAYPRPPFPPGGLQYGGPPSYGPPNDSYSRGGYNRGPPGPAERGGPDSYPRGGRGSYGGNYGPSSGYGYYQPGERRRFDDTDSTDPSTGPPPSKQPAFGPDFRSGGGGYQGDSYRGGFRGGRGSSDKGSFSQPASGGGYGYSYGSSYPPSAPQSKGGDSSTSGRYPSGGRADDFQSKQLGPYAGGGSKPSRFSSAAGEADKSISKPQDSPGSRFRSSGYQGFEGGKESGQPSRSRFDQPSQQNQDPYGLGGTYGHPGGGRQSGSTSGTTQGFAYGQYGQLQARTTGSDSSKSQQGYGADFGNRGSAATQQQSQKTPQTGYGNEFVARGSNLPPSQSQKPQQGSYGGGFGSTLYGRQQQQSGESSQRFSKGFGSGDQSGVTGSYNKPSQQESYSTDAYGQRSATGSGTSPSALKFPQSYESEFQGAKTVTKQSQETSQGGYYQGYGSAAAQSTGGTSGKPGQQQQSYGGSSVYGQQSGSQSAQGQSGYSAYGQQGGAALGATQQYQQQRYSGDSSNASASASSRGSAYGQQSTSQSKLDPRSYDYSPLFGSVTYIYGENLDNPLSAVPKPLVSAALPGSEAGSSSFYAAALSATAKGTGAATASSAYGSAAGQPAQQQQMSTSAYGFGGAAGYYGSAAATAAQASWHPYQGVAPGGQAGGSGASSGTSQTQQGYGYGQR
nr:e1b 55 kda associated protein [Hymenolepis microstoma]